MKLFAEISNPGIRVFIEKLENMIQIYGHTTEICFDEKKISISSIWEWAGKISKMENYICKAYLLMGVFIAYLPFF